MGESAHASGLWALGNEACELRAEASWCSLDAQVIRPSQRPQAGPAISRPSAFLIHHDAASLIAIQFMGAFASMIIYKYRIILAINIGEIS